LSYPGAPILRLGHPNRLPYPERITSSSPALTRQRLRRVIAAIDFINLEKVESSFDLFALPESQG
jgi:hypothetical protein